MIKVYGLSAYIDKVIVHGFYNEEPIQFEARLGNVWEYELVRGSPYSNRHVTWIETDTPEDFPKVLVVPTAKVPFLKKGNLTIMSVEKSLRIIDQLLKAARPYRAVPIALHNPRCAWVMEKSVYGGRNWEIRDNTMRKLPGLVPVGVVDGWFQAVENQEWRSNQWEFESLYPKKDSFLKSISGTVPEIISAIRREEIKRRTQYSGTYGIAITTDDGDHWDAYRFAGESAYADDNLRKISSRR